MSPAPRPLTSVIMPAYRAQETIGEAVESVLAQTVTDFELIVVDDASPEPVADALAGLADPRVRLIRRRRNGGPSAARNTALRAARAPLVSQLDADDMWEPDYLEHVLPHFADRGVGLVYANAEILEHPTGHDTYIFDPAPHPIDRFPKLAEQNPVPALTATMRTSAVRAVGGYARWLPMAQDYHLYLKLAAAGWHFQYVDRKLARFRWPGPNRGRTFDRRRHERCELRMWLAFALRHPITPGPTRQVRVRLRRELERLGDRRPARTARAAQESLGQRQDPGRPRTSVLMAAYNPDPVELSEAVESVLAQTVDALELIVVDDGSERPLREALEGERDPRLRIVRHEANRGLSAARNTALRLARAPLVSHLDSDDAWEPDYLEHVLPAFAEPEVGLAYTNAAIVGHPDGHDTYIFDPAPHPIDRFPKLAEQDPIPLLTATARTEAVRAAGGYACWLRSTQDYHLWCRMAAAGWRFAFIDRRLARYRWPACAGSLGADRRRVELDELLMWLSFFLRHPRIPGPRRQLRVRVRREIDRLRFAR